MNVWNNVFEKGLPFASSSDSDSTVQGFLKNLCYRLLLIVSFLYFCFIQIFVMWH